MLSENESHTVPGRPDSCATALTPDTSQPVWYAQYSTLHLFAWNHAVTGKYDSDDVTASGTPSTVTLNTTAGTPPSVCTDGNVVLTVLVTKSPLVNDTGPGLARLSHVCGTVAAL